MSDDFLIFEKGLDHQISEHFKTKEFDCPCSFPECKTTWVSKKLITLLEALRESLQTPIIINSGYRCEKHNRAVGGVSGSMHLFGRASDLRASRYTGLQLLEKAEAVGVKSIGLAKTWIHVDDRPKHRRWKY